MTEFERGFAAAKHQAANLMGHFIYDKAMPTDNVDLEKLAEECASAIESMQDNGTRP